MTSTRKLAGLLRKVIIIMKKSVLADFKKIFKKWLNIANQLTILCKMAHFCWKNSEVIRISAIIFCFRQIFRKIIYTLSADRSWHFREKNMSFRADFIPFRDFLRENIRKSEKRNAKGTRRSWKKYGFSRHFNSNWVFPFFARKLG